MSRQKLTYGQLFDKLKAIGFRQQAVELDGKRGQVFIHKNIDKAMIVLPDSDPKEEVEPFFMNSVIANLRAHDLLPNTPNPLLS